MAAGLIFMAACGDGTTEPPGTRPPPVDTTPAIDSVPVLGLFPAALSGLKLEQAVAYEVGYPLWSNGLVKQRSVLLPTGTVVDNSAEAWSFPVGTILLKSFYIRGPDGSTRPIETRGLLRLADRWETAVYLWDAQGTAATLKTSPTRLPVQVTNQAGHTFEHVVPGKGDCVNCHGAAPQFVLGFNELQVHAASDDQLAELNDDQVLSSNPGAGAEVIEGVDAEHVWVKGYMEGNCVECHNGQAQFSLEHQVFDEQVVGGTSQGGNALIVPGNPEASQIYVLMRDGFMPAVGVQVVDSASVARLGAWIRSLGGPEG